MAAYDSTVRSFHIFHFDGNLVWRRRSIWIFFVFMTLFPFED